MVSFRRLLIPAPWWLVIWVVVPIVAWRALCLLPRVVRFAVRHRGPLLTLGVSVWLWHRHGWPVLVGVLATTAASVALWWWRARESCTRWVLLPLLSWWRRLTVYRRLWHEVMTTCHLVQRYDGGHKMPELLSVRCTYATDEVLLRMPRGQNPDLYRKAAANLAYSFNSRHCRVFSTRRQAPPLRTGRAAWLLRLVDRVRYRDRPRLVWLVLIRRDPLTRIVPALPVPTRPDFTALPMGLREDMEPYLLRLLATHLLVVGATRAGKGSVIWSLIRALAAGVKSGLVRLWVIDPKGGMELFMGRPMFACYEDSDFAAMADMLDRAIEVMRERQARLRGKVRVHEPNLADPLIVIVIDELACLLAYLQDSELRNRITQSLALLLSQGAGLGVLVVGASQDPRKEVLTLRDLFPTRIALRLNEADHVDLVLGAGSRNRGALAEQIPLTGQGTGFVVLDYLPEPARVRFAYVTDEQIRDMAATFTAPPEPEPVAVPAQPTPKSSRLHTYRPGRTGPLLPDSLRDLIGGEPA
jgi:S-DNA-T family DNA segregation ATPase FtsK/SpoIIIE